MAKKGAINPHTTFVPNGVDFNAYASPARKPEDLAAITHPRIGYSGFIKKQLDWSLLLELASRHSEWSFVFVGPYSPHPQIVRSVMKLRGHDNVHFLGAKAFDRLPAYAQHFDVCIIPSQLNAYTENIYPMKLHEYLACGRPVVSAPIRFLRVFSNVIRLANGVDDWSNALFHALKLMATCPDAVAARQNIARQYDWEILVHEIAAILCDRMGSEYAHQFHEIGAKTPSLS